MYAKLVFRNAKRSVKDYLVYIVTMTICVTLFYAFLSISSSYYSPDIGSEYDFTLLSDGMKIAICMITLLLLFLIRFVNHYMLRRKQKEFAVQSIMGMEQKTIGRIFFAETLIMGMFSILIGIFCGVFCSQFITAMLLTAYGKPYEISWTLFPDTVLLTVVFFVASFFVVGIFNTRTIQKTKIIDMLSAEKENEPELKKSRFISVVVVLFEVFTVWGLMTGIQKVWFYYDTRFAFPVQLMFWGNILFPLLTLLWSIFCIIRKKKRECFIAGLLICSVLNAFTAASVAALTNKYYLSLGGGTLICITLVLAIFMFIAAPILTGWASGYLDMRSMYDVQVYSRYNDVYEEENLPQDSYEIITDFLTEHKIDTVYDCTFNLYLSEKDDFHNRQKYDFPIVAISLSDYNTIREMLGYEQISLEEDEFTTQWKAIATEEERDNFLKEHASIMTDAGELTLSGQSYYEDPIGETAYNSYTNVLYVLPDNICEKLLPVIKNRYITTTENISYENARKLEKLFTEKYPEQAETGAIYGVRFSTLQINSSIANNFILQTSMIYGAVVLMVICLTVLSLQQLLDAGQYKYRFSVLRKLGVEEKHIGKLILKQLSIWFGLPIITAIIVAAVVIAYFIQTISAEISAYIGFSTLMLQIGATMGILAILLICYFISTWIIFRRSVNP